jgi:hypothetical protein
LGAQGFLHKKDLERSYPEVEVEKSERDLIEVLSEFVVKICTGFWQVVYIKD